MANETRTLKQYEAEAGEIAITLMQVWLDDCPVHYTVTYEVGNDPLKIGAVRRCEVFPCDGLDAYLKANDLFADYVKAVL